MTGSRCADDERRSGGCEVVRELAVGLLALGCRPGESVAILAASRAEWVQADFAILSAGCTTVPLYPTSTPPQIADILRECETRTVIVAKCAPHRRYS